MTYYCKKPVTDLEIRASSQAFVFKPSLWQPVPGNTNGPFGATSSMAVTDMFTTPLDQDFAVDGPVFAALIPQLAAQDPEGLVNILATFLPLMSVTPDESDKQLTRLLLSFKESLVGAGNIAGNISAVNETVLRAVWRRKAVSGFEDLITGKKIGNIKLSQNITVESNRIGAGGELRKGARLTVKVKGMPMSVVHRIDPSFKPRSGGNAASLRVGAKDLQRIEQAAVSVASARVQSNSLLRIAGKGGGAFLAFGPSAGIDFYQSYTTQSGVAAVSKDFAARSAKSQSGNALGLGLGIAAVAAVGAVGAPAIIVGLGVGLAVQTVWGYFGGDDWAADVVKGWVN